MVHLQSPSLYGIDMSQGTKSPNKSFTDLKQEPIQEDSEYISVPSTISQALVHVCDDLDMQILRTDYLRQLEHQR